MKTLVIAGIAILLAAAAADAQEKPDFARDIQPILSRSCYECHGNPETDLKGRSKNPKGGLRLDAKSFILAPRRGGETLVKAGKPDDSLLFELIALPKGDPDLMPPDDDPLKAEEVALIKAWIAQGADFGAWEGTKAKSGEPAKKPESAQPAILVRGSQAELWAKLGRDLAPLPADKLAAASAHALVEPVEKGSGLYRVSFSSREDEVDDAALKNLSGMADRIVELRLARTKVSDAGMAAVARMNRLVKLDLRETKVGDAGLKELSELKELRSLNLVATAVSDAGLPTLVELPRLEVVFLWQSAAGEEAVQTLRKRLPRARILLGPRLPAPDEDEPAPRRRRGMN